MLRIRIDVNGSLIHEITILNRGAPAHESDTPQPDDLRVYRYWHDYSTDDDEADGVLLHSRGDGALALAAAVLTAMSR